MVPVQAMQLQKRGGRRVAPVPIHLAGVVSARKGKDTHSVAKSPILLSFVQFEFDFYIFDIRAVTSRTGVAKEI